MFYNTQTGKYTNDAKTDEKNLIEVDASVEDHGPYQELEWHFPPRVVEGYDLPRAFTIVDTDLSNVSLDGETREQTIARIEVERAELENGTDGVLNTPDDIIHGEDNKW